MRRLLSLGILLFAHVSFAVVFPETAVDAPVYYAPALPPLRLGAAVAAGAGSYLAAWEERASLTKAPSVYVRALQPSGVPRQPMAVFVARGETPAIAWNGSDYFVAWKNGSAVEGVRVTEAGVVLERTRVVVATAAGGRPALAWNGSQYAVVWGDGGALVDRYGSVVRALPAARAVVAFGENFVFADGKRLQLGAASADAGNDVVALTTNGKTITAFWSTGISIGITVFDANLRPLRTESTSFVTGSLAALQVGDEILAVMGAARTERGMNVSELEPALASNGTTTLLVYTERTGGVDAIKVAVSEQPSLTPSVQNGTTISTTGTAGSAPALALGDDRAMVAWLARDPASDKMNIVTGGATFTGAALPRHVVDGAAHPVDLTITRAGDRYLVMWADVDPFWREGPVRAAVVDKSGNVVAAPMTIGNGDRPTAASDGTRWFLAWETHSRISGLEVRLTVSTMSRAGGLGAVNEMIADLFRFEPYVAFDGRDFVMLWSESLQLGRRERIAAARFDVNGNLTSDVTVFDESPNEPRRIAGVAVSGGHVYALWTRGAAQQLVASADVGEPFEIAPSVAGARIAAATNGNAAVVYENGRPLMLTYVAPAGPAGTLDLPASATAWDFATLGNSVVLAYERAANPLEELGTSAVFVRGLEFRRHASR